MKKVARNNKFSYEAKYNELKDKYADLSYTNLKLKQIELEDDIHSIESDKSHEDFSNILSMTALFVGLWSTQFLNNAIFQLFAIIGAIALIKIVVNAFDRIKPYQDKLDKQRRALRVELLCVNETLSKLNADIRSEVKL